MRRIPSLYLLLSRREKTSIWRRQAKDLDAPVSTGGEHAYMRVVLEEQTATGGQRRRSDGKL